jgi:hypothetical protein
VVRPGALRQQDRQWLARSAQRAAGAPAASERLAQPRWITVGRVARYLGAAALAGVGVDHIWQFYVDSYSVIPTIGTLFALNFASALVIALGLVVPLQRLSPSWGTTLLALLAAGGAGIALGSFAGLEVSETTGLFGFMESGYRSKPEGQLWMLRSQLADSIPAPALRRPISWPRLRAPR